MKPIKLKKNSKDDEPTTTEKLEVSVTSEKLSNLNKGKNKEKNEKGAENNKAKHDVIDAENQIEENKKEKTLDNNSLVARKESEVEPKSVYEDETKFSDSFIEPIDSGKDPVVLFFFYNKLSYNQIIFLKVLL